MPQLEVKTSGDITGLRWQPGDAAAVLSRPARARDAPRVPPRPRRAVLTSSNSPERAAQSFLKFLALGCNNVVVTSTWLGAAAAAGRAGPVSPVRLSTPDEVPGQVIGVTCASRQAS